MTTNSATAAFVLREAEAAGFAFASNGVEMVTRAPPGSRGKACTRSSGQSSTTASRSWR